MSDLSGRTACPSCGALNDASGAFCWQCHAAVRQRSAQGFSDRGALQQMTGANGDVRTRSSRGMAASQRSILMMLVLAAAAAATWFLVAGRHNNVSFPEEFEGAQRVGYREVVGSSPFEDHAPATRYDAGYGTDPAAPGSFGVSVWVVEGRATSTTTAQILTLAPPEGVKVDVFAGVSATVDGADFECAPSTTNASTMCAWTSKEIDGFLGTREPDLQAALAQAERLRSAIGA
jgi:hypothetical protein